MKKEVEYSTLSIQVEHIPLLGESRVCAITWDGNFSIAKIPYHSFNYIGQAELERFLGFPIELVGKDFDLEASINGEVLIRRLDTACYSFSRFQEYCRRFWSFMPAVERKLILTLCVWEFGYVEPGQIINWTCIGKKRWS